MQYESFQVTGLQESTLNPCSSSQLFWYSFSVSPEQSDKETNQSMDSEDMEDLTRDDLVKLVAEKEEMLMLQTKEYDAMKDKFLRSFSFVKGILDVADNLGRASSVVKASFAKIDTSEDASGAVPLLKTLLKGVEMTETQLTEAFDTSRTLRVFLNISCLCNLHCESFFIIKYPLMNLWVIRLCSYN
ncbi:hypothetical protein MKX03_022002 [Papaver bracteatum]|nr:hypothetical protein MKX03_022002 [Papaver bracteatum]